MFSDFDRDNHPQCCLYCKLTATATETAAAAASAAATAKGIGLGVWGLGWSRPQDSPLLSAPVVLLP